MQNIPLWDNASHLDRLLTNILLVSCHPSETYQASAAYQDFVLSASLTEQKGLSPAGTSFSLLSWLCDWFCLYDDVSSDASASSSAHVILFDMMALFVSFLDVKTICPVSFTGQCATCQTSRQAIKQLQDIRMLCRTETQGSPYSECPPPLVHVLLGLGYYSLLLAWLREGK